MSLNTLVHLQRGRHAPAVPPRRLPVPDGMTAPMGCDAVAVPARFGPLVMPRLPRVGCVYADEAHWWWLVPSDSDYALEWPAPARYDTGALVPDGPRLPDLIHRPDCALPYTPPIPLYLAVCRLTDTTPSWSRPITA
ncbi:hypothetical protein JL475_17730 [Streptomyces sp. M2CJ-2]|uniref:hypothetical protein n=1 Tax=Streptomyces sp. M2CJ-2 TaxID=2803948 RepID=UPI0019294F3C|nr:hypothetical protein [Streptomyces sp. M2CJ-2]MBL3667794.1 hypothetical protein [Streptomyces sp. M2CJ-2]